MNLNTFSNFTAALCLLALFAVCGDVQAQTNSPATGMPGVTYVTGITAPTEDSPITANGGSGSTAIADTDGLGTFSWQWSQADTNGGTYTAIAMATNAAFTPLQAHVGMFLQVCASFMDGATPSNEEERCLQIATAVANVDDVPVALPNTIDVPVGTDEYTFAFDDFTYTDEDGADDLPTGVRIETVPATGTGSIVIGALVRDGGADSVVFRLDFGGNSTPRYRLPDDAVAPAEGYASFTFTLLGTGGAASNTATMTIDLVGAETQMPATGAPTVTVPMGSTAWNEDAVHTATIAGIRDPNGFSASGVTWQWQQADAPGGGAAPAEGAWADMAAATASTFTPLQAHVGSYVRVCASFMDSHTPPADETRCTAGNIIANVDDAPVALGGTIFVPVGGTHTFSFDDFPYTDEDGDTASLVGIVSINAAGTGELQESGINFRGSSAPLPYDYSDAGIRTVTYTPPNTATTPAMNFASFTYRVATGTPTAVNSNTATMTIDLVAATQAAATGAPTVTAASGTAYNEDVELTASVTGTVTDANGIPTRNLRWQWQSAAAPASGTPADGDYAAIAGATADKFTPLQAHVGRFIRACLSFADGLGNAEGPLCSAPAAGNAIANVNDAPTSGECLCECVPHRNRRRAIHIQDRRLPIHGRGRRRSPGQHNHSHHHSIRQGHIPQRQHAAVTTDHSDRRQSG